MPESRVPDAEPEAFARLRAFVSSGRTRTETTVAEIPSPSRIAPFSLALAADVSGAVHGVDSDLGTGRFIALHDPAEPEGWGGAYRIVTFAQAPLEPEIGVDEFVADVTWSWLVDALGAHGARYANASGTATKIISRGYGEPRGAGRRCATGTPGVVDAPRRRPDAARAGVGGDRGDARRTPPASDGVSLLAPRRLARD